MFVFTLVRCSDIAEAPLYYVSLFILSTIYTSLSYVSDFSSVQNLELSYSNYFSNLIHSLYEYNYYTYFCVFYHITIITKFENLYCSETQDALETISTFLKNEAGAKFLTGLVQSQNKAILTTDELMEAVLGATEKNGTVWRAAATLKSALEATQSQQETIPSDRFAQLSSETVTDYWNDVITDMEKHDDIICLYRKDTEAKMKKSSDWQKLLKNVSPGYTVHLALDRGSKYVICLKKVNVPVSQTSQTVPSSTLIASVQDASSNTPILAQIKQSLENDEDLTTSVEASTEPSVPKNTSTFSTTHATKSLIQNTIPVTTEDVINAVKSDKDCYKGNTCNDDSVKSSKDGSSKSLKINYAPACSKSWEKSKSEKLNSAPLLNVKLEKAGDIKNPERFDEGIAISNERDCLEESDTPEIIKSLKPKSFASENRTPVISPTNCVPCLPTPMCSVPYMPQLCAQENYPNLCQFSEDIDRNFETQMTTASVSKPFFNNVKNIPTRLNFAETNKRENGPSNPGFNYSTEIPSQQFISAVKLEAEKYLIKKLLLETRDAAKILSRAHPPIMPPHQTSADCLKVSPPTFAEQNLQTNLISNARVPLLQVQPTISTYETLSNAQFNLKPYFLPSQSNSIELSGEKRNSPPIKPIIPLYQTEDFLKPSGEQNSRFQKNLPPQIEPPTVAQNHPEPMDLIPTDMPRIEPRVQSPSMPICRQNPSATTSPTLLSSNKPIISHEFELPSTPSNIFPNVNPSSHRTSFPQIPICNPNCNQLPLLPTYSSPNLGNSPISAPEATIENKLPLQDLNKVPYFSNSLFPIQYPRYPDSPRNMRYNFSPKIPIQNGGSIFGNIKLLLMPKNSMKRRKTPSIDLSVLPANNGVNKLIRKEVGNTINFSDYIRTMLPVFVPKNLFNAPPTPGRQKLNDKNSHIHHNRTCPNTYKEPIPFGIKIHGSKADLVRMNVLPGKGERVNMIDAKKGLVNVQRKGKSNSLDKVFKSRKNLVKKSTAKSTEDDNAKSLESRIDKTADKLEKHISHTDSTEDKSLPGITTNSLIHEDEYTIRKALFKTEETTKLNKVPEIIDATENTGSANVTAIELYNT